MGNTCYANSVLQAIYHCEVFRDLLLDTPVEDKESIAHAIRVLFRTMRDSDQLSGAISPNTFLKTVFKSNGMSSSGILFWTILALFVEGRQQDAHEFLNYVLNELSEYFGKIDQKAVVGDIFEGKISSEMVCSRCETSSESFEAFLDLSIQIRNHTSVSHCLGNFSTPEVLRGANKYFCDECNCHQEATKTLRIHKAPKVLILQLKRFKYAEEVNGFKKLSYRVPFPFHLRVEGSENLYELFAVIVHIGSMIRSGHYVCMVKKQGTWVIYDDERIQMISEDTVRSCFGRVQAKHHQDGYILFYQC